jgi:aryl-alcohol dehydrogenase-like predicted oxidoreductase
MSRLALGTAQFGMPYGIANAIGQPGAEQVHGILDAALELGISDLDTASGYGSAESVLGSWTGRDRCRIVSKFSPPPGTPPEPAQLENGLRSSLRMLRVTHLHGFLLHDSVLVFEQAWIRALAGLKGMGLAGKVGISVYEPEEALAAARDPRIDIIQVPYNLLDQRLDRTDFFELARRESKEVWVRSAFLQGLLLLEEPAIPRDLAGIVPLRRALAEVSNRHGFELGQAALLHCLSKPGVHRVVVGVESIGQLRSNAAIPALEDSFGACREELSRIVGDGVDPYLVSPNRWRKR